MERIIKKENIMKQKKYKLPKIGLRIIKSAVGVFLCYVINLLRNGQGIVFYSQLAGLWCMQDYVSETKSKAKQRSLGTLVGALAGLVYIMLIDDKEKMQGTGRNHDFFHALIKYGIFIFLHPVRNGGNPLLAADGNNKIPEYSLHPLQ